MLNVLLGIFFYLPLFIFSINLSFFLFFFQMYMRFFMCKKHCFFFLIFVFYKNIIYVGVFFFLFSWDWASLFSLRACLLCLCTVIRWGCNRTKMKQVSQLKRFYSFPITWQQSVWICSLGRIESEKESGKKRNK